MSLRLVQKARLWVTDSPPAKRVGRL